MLLVNLVQTKPVTFSLSISIYATYTFDVSTCELWFGIGTNRTNHNKRDNLKAVEYAMRLYGLLDAFRST